MHFKLLLVLGSVAMNGAHAACRSRSHSHLSSSISTSSNNPSPSSSFQSALIGSTTTPQVSDITPTSIAATPSTSSTTFSEPSAEITPASSVTPRLSTTPISSGISSSSSVPSSSNVTPIDLNIVQSSALTAAGSTTLATTTIVPAITSSSTAPASTTSAASPLNTGGFATFYYQNGNNGICGQFHLDNDLVVAIREGRFEYSSSGANLSCSKQIRITNTNNGRSVLATVVDVCPTCMNENSLDLSVGAFSAIASLSDGMVPIVWQFV